MALSELRVHGMSGTPPRDLLYSDPVSYDRSDPYAQIFEHSRDGPEVKAFHWGSLTSGSRFTAFWILLSPFMLANVAGWMAASRPLVHAFIRVAAVGMSGLFVAQGLVVMVDLTNQVVAGESYHQIGVALGAVALGALFLVIVWKLSTRSLISRLEAREQLALLFGVGEDSLSPPGMTAEELSLHEEDPARGARLKDARLWVRQSVLHRLRRQHLATGLVIAAIGMELGLGSEPLLIVAYVVVTMVVVDTFVVSFPGRFSGLVHRISAINVHLGVALFATAVIHVFVGSLPMGPWPNVHRLVFFVAAGAGVAAGGAALAQLLRSHRKLAAFLPLSALAIGTLVGGALGVAAAVFAELMVSRFLVNLNPFQSLEDFDIEKTQVMANGGAWTTVAMFCFALGLVGLAGYATWRGKPQLPDSEGRSWAVLRRATRRAPYLFGGAGVLAVLLALVATFILAFNGWDPSILQVDMSPDLLPWIALAVALFMIIGLAGAVRNLSWVGAAVVVVLGGAGLWAIWFEPLDERVFVIPLAQLPLHPSRLLDASFLLIVLGLTYFILRSILGGIGDPEKRRKVGMLWDTGSFWPRWFHPLAPPAYGPHAVKSLASALRSQRPSVLAAHSQGSVISAVTLASQDTHVPEGLVTYGSPLGILYSKLFPDVGVDDLVRSVYEQWNEAGHHWVNLWRNTDPLGGEPLSGMTGNRLVCSGAGHSHYELTPEFFSARPEAVAGVTSGVSPTDIDLQNDPCRQG